jgi:hypothetical protein
MRRPVPADARVDARIAVIELRSLLVADAPISLHRRADLIRRAAGLVRLPGERERIIQRLTELIERRFGRNPETFEPSRATNAALRLLSEMQEGAV